MRITILRMLSSNSLSAFSSVGPVRPGNPAAIRPVRAQTQTGPGSPAPAGTELGLAPFPPRQPGERVLPRGSLVDFSV